MSLDRLARRTSKSHAVVKQACLLAILMIPGACTGLFTRTTVVDTSRGPRVAQLCEPDLFTRLVVDDRRAPLRSAGLPDDDRLLVIERSGERLAFRERDLAYHHVAQ